jgi:small ligand-binding sensory domain FIST
MYREADHDSIAIREALGDIPSGGFFCNGECVAGGCHSKGSSAAAPP